MSALLCCCCPRDSTADEREPLVGALESARRPRQPSNAVEQRKGKIIVRHVGIPDLDQRFSDVAETFNKQHVDYERMEGMQKNLLYRYRCSSDGNLSECLMKIKDEHDTHQVRLQMRGYDFTLAVTPNEDVPDKLKRTQENVKELCQSAKAIVAVSTKLQEMINWLLRAEENLKVQVKESAGTHQERSRLEGNFGENMREARRAKEISLRYRDEAGKLLNEAALLSGVTL